MFRFVVLSVAVLFAFAAFGNQSKSQSINIGQKHVFYSEILGEDRQIWISLPSSYDPESNTRYPVLYFLDAENNHFFPTFASMAKQMAADASPVIPELIVVGVVSQNRLFDSSPTRSLTQYGGKDHPALANTGGASRFLKFISSELLPFVNQKYKTSNYNIFMGYSFSGLPVIHGLYTMPNIFNAYMAIDPSMWWDDQIMLSRLNAFRENYSEKKRTLFIATTERVSKVYPKENYVGSFIEALTINPLEGLTLYSKNYGTSENHHSMPILAFYDGLRSIFDGFMIDEEARFRTANELQKHFKQISTRLGTEFKPREGLINWFGNDRIYNDQFPLDPQEGINFLKLNTIYYPKSVSTWVNLAKAYVHDGNIKKAKEFYLKALTLAPNNKKIKAALNELES